MKKRTSPFNTFQSEYVVDVPDPIVEFIDKEDVTIGNKKKAKKIMKREIVKSLKTSEFNKEFPLSKEEFSLQDLIDAGVPLKEVPTAIYEKEVNQLDLLSRVEAYIDKKEGTYNKQEK